jgi:hypothetical protein
LQWNYEPFSSKYNDGKYQLDNSAKNANVFSIRTDLSQTRSLKVHKEAWKAKGEEGDNITQIEFPLGTPFSFTFDTLLQT